MPPNPDNSAAVGVQVRGGPETPPANPATKPPEAQKITPAESARLDATAAVVTAWADKKAVPTAARPLLEGIAAERAVQAAGAQVDSLNSKLQGIKSEKESKPFLTLRAEALRVLENAQKLLDAHEKRMENMMKNPKIPVVDRLFAYDMKLAQLMHDGSAMEAVLQQAESDISDPDAPPEQRAKAAAEKKAATDKIIALVEQRKTLEAERGKIGTPEQQQVNYVTALAMKLNGGAALTDVQKNQLENDPLQFLQDKAAEPGGLAHLLKNSGISQKDQDKLLAVASADAIKRSMKLEKTTGTIKDRFKQGILALLVLLYTAYGANKKAKPQMG